MTDDVSTAYICIYCPFNSHNLEALEAHLTSKDPGCVSIRSVLPMCVTLQVRTGMDIRTRHKPYHHRYHRVFFTKAINVKRPTTNRYEIYFDCVHPPSFTRQPSQSSLNPNRSISVQQQVLLKTCACSIPIYASFSSDSNSAHDRPCGK